MDSLFIISLVYYLFDLSQWLLTLLMAFISVVQAAPVCAGAVEFIVVMLKSQDVGSVAVDV